MTAIMLIRDRMNTTLDARGLACPLPAIKARRALTAVPPGAALIVLATDPEAPIDVAAVAADAGCTFAVEERDGGWRMTLRRPAPAPATPPPGPPRR
jgi:tRNA 2-thiouridine synthesizing protein A